jgi:hypothetical protein
MNKNQIEIEAGSDYYIKFNSEIKKFESEEIDYFSKGLSNREISAIAKTPVWIHRSLIQQFKNINNSIGYVRLIEESDIRYTDEIAFSIAHSPLGNIPSVDVLMDNVKILYQNDEFVNYSDIIDYDFGNGYYFSTIRYKVFENNTVKYYELPMDVYYWYVVHPRINREEPMLVYNKTWREYLFHHNDVGHPLMKEKVDDVQYLWDGGLTSNDTGIKVLGYWIGNNIRYEIIGDRPGQPNNIAHEHTGYCGETQKLVVAAYRSALIPINGVMNYAEDHVWCEFFERGWYHIDGAVNNPYMYTDGWGKDMSSIWAWNGDSSIYEVTSKYLHPEERINVEFNIYDGYNNPIDGAIVTVLVKGLKDITWYKDYFLDIIDEIWLKIPDIFKGRILNKIYEKIHEKIGGIDEVIEASQVSIWNYTDVNGRCNFQLGKNDEYIFLIQKPDIRYPWPISKNNRIRMMSDTQNKTYNIHFFDYSNKIIKHEDLNEMQGDYEFSLKVNLSSYQLQRNILTRDIGRYEDDGVIDFFILDEENFDLYKNGKKFNCYFYKELRDSEINFNLDDNDYYIVFRNHAHMTNVILDYEILVQTIYDYDGIEIVSPSTNIFEEPIYTIGTLVDIKGVSASDSVNFKLGDLNENISKYNGFWSYQWNTSFSAPGDYIIEVNNDHNFDARSIKLVDNIPPKIEIISPENYDIFEDDLVTISGLASDNYKLDSVEIIVDDNDPIIIGDNNEWFYDIDLSIFDPGEYIIKVKAIDYFGLTSIDEIIIIKNNTEVNHYPNINSIFISPENPNNSSNIIFYSNVTSESPFSIKEVFIIYENGMNTIRNKLHRYGDFPPQERHVEDNIQNIPNDPIYGIELGRFETGQNISCWIEAIDNANNKNISSKFTFQII